jgi:hypothetical protein
MEEQKENYIGIFWKIALILVALSILFPFSVNYFFSDWAKSGTFGDTFGALNALFSGLAFTGVIVTILIQRTELNHQRTELGLQRDEMKETRKEFLLNRTTNLVYNQLDRFEKALEEFTFSNGGIKYVGNEAFSFLDTYTSFIANPPDKTENAYLKELKDETIKLSLLYAPNISQIEKFAHNAYNSVAVLQRLIFKTDLDVEHLNDLKSLFFVNIGFLNMGVINQISEVAVNEIDIISAQEHALNNIEVGQLMNANLFLKSIIEFEKIDLTENNFIEHKQKWEQDNRLY